MSVRQYIGARYVTKIYENSLDPSSAEWEGGRAYEPLTLVTYLNSSYLSKKEVPASVGDPASNPTYWVITGAYNGQIATLQNQIDTINNQLTAFDYKKRVIIVGDSYGTGYNPDGDVTPYPDILNADWSISTDNLINASLYNAAFSRSPYFTDALAAVTVSDPDNITDIYVVGGFNDHGANASDISAGMASFKTYALANYPNAKLHIVYCCNYRGDSPTYRQQIFNNKFTYASSAGVNGFTYDDISNILMTSGDVSSDHYHPTQQGQYQIAYAVGNIIYGNNDFNRLTTGSESITAESPNVISYNGVSISIKKTMTYTTIVIGGYMTGTFDLTKIAWNKIAKISNNVLSFVSSTVAVPATINIKDSSNVYHSVPCQIGFDSNYLYIRPQGLNAAGTDYESYTGAKEIAFDTQSFIYLSDMC